MEIHVSGRTNSILERPLVIVKGDVTDRPEDIAKAYLAVLNGLKKEK